MTDEPMLLPGRIVTELLQLMSMCDDRPRPSEGLMTFQASCGMACCLRHQLEAIGGYDGESRQLAQDSIEVSFVYSRTAG
jgi:hypothetical protein